MIALQVSHLVGSCPKHAMPERKNWLRVGSCVRACVRARVRARVRACPRVRACVRAWVRARACVCACVPARACVSVCVFDTSDCSASIPMLRHDSCAIRGHEHAKVSCTFRFVSMRCAAQINSVLFQTHELWQNISRDSMVSRTSRPFMSVPS